MKPKLFLRSPSFPHLELESIDEGHLEHLRRLKNAHRYRFFHQDEISPEQQLRWYAAYRTRPDDWMFIIHHNGSEKGCIGYRIIDGSIDLYNFMKGQSGDVRPPFTHHAFDLLCSFAGGSTGLPIRGRVLDGNPFLQWIQKHGFVIISRGIEAGLPYTLVEQDPRLRASHLVTVESVAMAASHSPAVVPL
jgi:hypothetical protein